MTLILTEPFNSMAAWTNVSGTIVAGGVVGTCCQVIGSGNGGVYTATPAQAGPIVEIEFWYQVSSLAVNRHPIQLRVSAGSVNQATLRVQTDGSMAHSRGGVTGANLSNSTTAPGLITINTWYKIKWRTKFGAGTTGEAQIWINDVLRLSLTGVDTLFTPGAGPNIDQIVLIGPGTSINAKWDELTLDIAQSEGIAWAVENVSWGNRPVIVTVAYTGACVDYTIPSGVFQIQCDLSGARGGGNSAGNFGGSGANIKAIINVTPGEVIRVCTGGRGTSIPEGGGGNGSGGFNGGGNSGGIGSTAAGGGGGATTISRSPYTLADRLVTAGGGGGYCRNDSALGGHAGYPNGFQGGNDGVGTPAGGGTQTAGGAGGVRLTRAGTPGTLGQGGQGYGDAAQAVAFGGGGGGGVYGGGGGGDNGAGGGGSSGIGAGVTLISAETTGTNRGHGSATLIF